MGTQSTWGTQIYRITLLVLALKKSIDLLTNMAEQCKQYGQEKAEQPQQTSQGMKDMTQEKASQGTDATKGMGQSITGKAQEGKEQTGSFFQQAGDKAKGATQGFMDAVKSPFGGEQNK